MKTFTILKRICDEHNLQIIDVNDYDQPDFRKKFDKLTSGRKVAIAFVSNKFNKIQKKGSFKEEKQ